jgi:ubiquinone/menaquinone biosynthesis C-methylase UbiE
LKHGERGTYAIPADAQFVGPGSIAIPAYLTRTYWWAYVHPQAVRLFERRWLVNVILWGNFGRLRDEALDPLGATLPGRTLQIACVYGDLTSRLAARIKPGGRLDVVDVLPIQLDNLASKLRAGGPVTLMHGDSTSLDLPTASCDRALLFFLLHEQPEHVRRATLAEAVRVVKPGGRIVIVDYHRPAALNPLFWPMVAILRTLEPFAMDLWEHELDRWLPPPSAYTALERTTSFGGLYQLVTITV